jgi:hypothetical protein
MRELLTTLRWYWFTRAAGLVVFMNEVFLDKHSADRTTIIIAACGLMGLDKVARASDDDKHAK